MAFKKYVKKQTKRAGKYLKKRYAPGGKLDIERIASDLAKVKYVLNTERKYHDSTLTEAAIDGFDSANGWRIAEPDLVPEGAGGVERNGQQVRFKSLHVKGRFIRAAAPSATAERVRMIIFMDKEPLVSGLGTNPTVTNLYNSNAFDSMTNWQSMKLQKRFTILYSKTFILDGDDPEKTFNVYKRLNYRAAWTDVATGDAIQNNKIYIAYRVDQPNANATRPGVVHIARMTFVDN